MNWVCIVLYNHMRAYFKCAYCALNTMYVFVHVKLSLMITLFMFDIYIVAKQVYYTYNTVKPVHEIYFISIAAVFWRQNMLKISQSLLINQKLCGRRNYAKQPQKRQKRTLEIQYISENLGSFICNDVKLPLQERGRR